MLYPNDLLGFSVRASFGPNHVCMTYQGVLDLKLNKHRARQWAPENGEHLWLAATEVPVPKDVMLGCAGTADDFEALWQSDVGSASILHEPRRRNFQTQICYHG